MTTTKTQTDKELATELNVSVRTIGRWRKLGYPLHDLNALREKIAGQHRGPESAEPESITAAKLKKLLIDIETAQLKLNVARRQYVDREEMKALLARLSLRTKQACQRILTEPPNWAGLTPVELSRRGRSIFDAICAELSNPGNY